MSATPDTVIDHIPEKCAKCGKSLETVEVTDHTHHQVIDIPKPCPIYMEHRSYHKICPCCGIENRGVYPVSVKAPIQYGENVKSTVAYMSVYQYLLPSNVLPDVEVPE
jgi:transposase